MIFNRALFNGSIFGGEPATGSYSSDHLVFNNFSLSDNSSMTLGKLSISGPKRNIIEGDSPRTDGKYLIASYYEQTLIEATGYAKAATAAAMDALLDTIRYKLSGQSGNLDYTDFNGTAKRYVATCDNTDQIFAGRQGYHITVCPWTIRFRCDSPFARSRAYSSDFVTATSSPYAQSVINAGTATTYPLIVLIFDSASGVNSVTIANVTTGEQIQYSGSIAAGNVLIIDGENKQLKLNGTVVAYSGVFPSMPSSTNNFSISFTGTASIESTIAWKAAYL